MAYGTVRSRLVLAGAVAGVLGGALPAPGVDGAAADQDATQQRPACTFHVVFKHARYRRGDPIEATFTLTNEGRAPVYVNKRLLLNGKDAPPEDREVTLEVTTPSGKSIDPQGPREVGLPRTEEFVLLSPGESVTSEHPKNLAAFGGFDEPGTYAIVGAYQNVFGPELGLDTVKGPVRSQPASITLEE